MQIYPVFAFFLMIYMIFRSNSHPHLVAMVDVNNNDLDMGRGSGQCIDRVYLEAKTLKETKSIILITAKDQSK